MVTTCQKLVTTLLHHVEAFLLTADIFEGGLHTRRWLLEFLLTEAAFSQVLLVARFTGMIRLRITLRAEVFAASVTSDTESGEMLGGFASQRHSLIVLLSLNNFTGHHFHYIVATACNKVGVLLDDLQRLILFNISTLLGRKELIELAWRNRSLATRTADFFAVRQLFHACFTQTVYMHLMEAVRRLEHCHIVVLHVDIKYNFLAEFTQLIFTFSLQLHIECLSPLTLGWRHELVQITCIDHFSLFLFFALLLVAHESFARLHRLILFKLRIAA